MPRRSNAGKVGDRTVRNFEFLYRLASTRSPKMRWNMVQRATRDELLAIMDICANILHKEFQLSPREDRRLKRYWEFMKKLSRTRSPNNAMKIIQQGEGIAVEKTLHGNDRVRVVQRGGAFLPALLVPILVELAASGAGYLLSKITS